MARTTRQVPAVYFGRPGALVSLPWPRGDVDKGYLKQVSDFVIGSGAHVTYSLPSGARAYTLRWNALHVDNFNLLDQYWSGNMGVGPWALIDPSAMNLLLPNQAGATSNLGDATGFATSNGAANMGTLLSNSTSTFIHRAGGSRSLQWLFPVAAATSPRVFLASPYRNWYGLPVVPNAPYVFKVWGRPDGTIDSSITMSVKIEWLAADGTSAGDSSSGDVVMTGWTNLIVSANAPANAAYGRPAMIATGSTITTGASIYIDELIFEQDSVTNNPWAPGLGCRAVEIMSLADQVTFETRMRKACDMVVLEVAS